MLQGQQYKVILQGEVGVGKTTLFLRLKNGSFHKKACASCQLDRCSKSYVINDSPVRLDVWDTAGMERFRTMSDNFYRHTHAVVFVYSVDNKSSLQHLTAWIDDSDNIVPDTMKILVGNKKDLTSEVSSEMAQDFASIHGCEFIFNSSAKTGEGVEDVFRTIASKLTERRYGPWIESKIQLTERTGDGSSYQSNCCY